MPIIFVDESILDYKLECVLCPVKSSQYLCFQEVCGLIFDKAGEDELYHEFQRVNPFDILIPCVSTGLALSKEIIHIVGADMTFAPDFKNDLYIGYERTLRLIVDRKYNSVIFPPIGYSYKRLGDLYSYRTCMSFLHYFMELYDILSTNIYVLIKKQTMQDHIDNYVSTYVSYSLPSRRHKPKVFPLKTLQEVQDYINENEVEVFKEYHKDNNYNLTIKNTELYSLCKLIKDKFGDDDIGFCMKSNLNKKNYIKLIETNYIPTKNELAGICMALELELLQAYHFHDMCNYKLEYDNDRDCEVIAAIATHKYDTLKLNQLLFLKGLEQIGSNIHPSEFAVNS